jgi:rhamnulokinase
MAEAAEPFRSLFDPDDPGLAAPGGMPGRIAAAIAASGDPAPEDDGAMVRAILDSVALRTAEVIRSLAEVAGRRLDRVVVVGGGAANGLLNRLVSACSGLPVVVGSTESTSLGNAVVQIASSRGLRSRSDLAGLLPVARPVADPDDLPEVRRLAAAAGVRLAALDPRT